VFCQLNLNHEQKKTNNQPGHADRGQQHRAKKTEREVQQGIETFEKTI
jgi:hypothetical protein